MMTGSGAARPLTVLHVTSVESANYHLNNLYDHTDPAQVRLLAATFGAPGGFVEALRQRGAKAVSLHCRTRSSYPRAARALARLIRDESVDIVHTHLFDPTLVGLWVGRRLRRPVIVTRHHSDALHRLPGLRRALYLRLEGWINRRADHLIAPSRAVHDILVGREGVPPAKISLVPYPQTAERFDAVTAQQVDGVRRELGMDGALALVCVARLHPEKGHEVLFQAFASFLRSAPAARLYLLGVGPLRSTLEGRVAQAGLGSAVRFLGWREDALAVMRAADVIVHPSFHEALPSAVIEATLLERPLVATDVAGVRDVLGDDDHGRVVPAGDPEALRRALVDTVQDLPAARERACRGRRFVLERMDARRVAEAHVACYRKLVNGAVVAAGTASPREA